MERSIIQTRVKSWEDLDFTRLSAATLRGLVEITLVTKMAGLGPAIFYWLISRKLSG